MHRRVYEFQLAMNVPRVFSWQLSTVNPGVLRGNTNEVDHIHEVTSTAGVWQLEPEVYI